MTLGIERRQSDMDSQDESMQGGPTGLSRTPRAARPDSTSTTSKKTTSNSLPSQQANYTPGLRIGMQPLASNSHSTPIQPIIPISTREYSASGSTTQARVGAQTREMSRSESDTPTREMVDSGRTFQPHTLDFFGKASPQNQLPPQGAGSRADLPQLARMNGSPGRSNHNAPVARPVIPLPSNFPARSATPGNQRTGAPLPTPTAGQLQRQQAQQKQSTDTRLIAAAQENQQLIERLREEFERHQRTYEETTKAQSKAIAALEGTVSELAQSLALLQDQQDVKGSSGASPATNNPNPGYADQDVRSVKELVKQAVDHLYGGEFTTSPYPSGDEAWPRLPTADGSGVGEQAMRWNYMKNFTHPVSPLADTADLGEGAC
jgi:hypothetical protein